MEPHRHLSKNELSNKKPRVEIPPSEIGCGHYGCSHYKRRCKIIAPCCNEIFDCRFCHNESKQNSIEVKLADWHDISRHDVKRVICSLCGTEQDVQQMCINCGVCMGRYFCSKCKFFDDDLSKKQFHCDECGICRNGGVENMFHCNTCGFCYSSYLKDKHKCMEKAMHTNCPICFEFLFDTTKAIALLACGHNMHLGCIRQLQQRLMYACPVCSKSFCDMSVIWEKVDEIIESRPMPEEYQNVKIWILCNDCVETSEVSFHTMALKCPKCKSYNTRRTQAAPAEPAASAESAAPAESDASSSSSRVE
ncbi:hypothetical protein AAZX31_03G166400 [Glycine max]